MTNDSQWLEENGPRALPLSLKALAENIEKIPANKAERGPEDDFALDSARKAYYKTARYFAILLSKGGAVRRDEFDIAKAWESTASMLSQYDRSLGTKLSAKASYWQEDATWSVENVERANAELEGVNRAISSRSL